MEDYETEIRNMQQLLLQTDYVALKIAEDETLKDKYSETLAKRKEWRAKINEMEALINDNNSTR